MLERNQHQRADTILKFVGFMHGYIAGNRDISLRCSRFPQRNFFEKKKTRQLRLRHVVSKKEKKGIKAKAGLESYKGQSS